MRGVIKRADSSEDNQAELQRCFPAHYSDKPTCDRQTDVVIDEPLHVSQAGHEGGGALSGPILIRPH